MANFWTCLVFIDSYFKKNLSSYICHFFPILVPVLITALLATGYQQIDYNYDPEYLFSPTDGEAKQERATLEHFFPTNFSDFKASRITRPGKFGRVIVAAKDGNSMLRTHLWDQLLYLDQVSTTFEIVLLRIWRIFVLTIIKFCIISAEINSKSCISIKAVKGLFDMLQQ